MFRRAVAVLSLLLLAGCGGEEALVEPDDSPLDVLRAITITGTVRSEVDGTAISGASVTLAHLVCLYDPCGVDTVAVVQTDGSGAYVIQDSLLFITTAARFRDHRVSVLAPGYNPRYASRSWTDQAHHVLDFWLTAR